jgi:hypothetical protein
MTDENPEETEEQETVASGTDSSASTGSMTEEPPEEGATGATEPAEAAGPQSQADQSTLEEEPDTDLDTDPDAGLDADSDSDADSGSDSDTGSRSDADESPAPDDHGLDHTRKNDVDGDRTDGNLGERVREHDAIEEVREHEAVEQVRTHDAVEQVREKSATDVLDTSDPVALAAFASVLFSWYQFYVRKNRQYGLFVGLWAPTLLTFADYLQNADVADTIQNFRDE